MVRGRTGARQQVGTATKEFRHVANQTGWATYPVRAAADAG